MQLYILLLAELEHAVIFQAKLQAAFRFGLSEVLSFLLLNKSFFLLELWHFLVGHCVFQRLQLALWAASTLQQVHESFSARGHAVTTLADLARPDHVARDGLIERPPSVSVVFEEFANECIN